MIDGIPLIDAHVHAGRLSSLNPAVREWAASFQAEVPLKRLYDGAGDLVPDRFEAYLRSEGVEMAILVPEYSPKVTGIQAVEDLFPLLEYNPTLFRFMANLNPHLHDPIAAELDRQIELGAVGLKIHPVHGGCRPGVDRAGGPRFPGTHDCAGPRWASVVVRGGSGPSARPAQHVDRNLRPAAEKDQQLLEAVRSAAPSNQVHLRLRLARSAGGPGECSRDRQLGSST